MIKRKVKINSFYGVRLPGTMKDEKIWYEVNEKSAKYLLVLGIIIIFVSALFYFSAVFSSTVSVIIMTVIVLTGVVSLAIFALIITNRLSKLK
ncbi:hypothetical protein MNBD_IGNAVI01-2781 [hydrothermal vent metagenome]|uniref:Uncharacterized protein n=1 Tax=hydrothermal vent metagenome TaxID=652676 RepID=A0A3B1CTI6_9ZZZZ